MLSRVISWRRLTRLLAAAVIALVTGRSAAGLSITIPTKQSVEWIVATSDAIAIVVGQRSEFGGATRLVAVDRVLVGERPAVGAVIPDDWWRPESGSGGAVKIRFV